MKRHLEMKPSLPKDSKDSKESKQPNPPRGERADQANIPPTTDDRGGRQSSGDAPRTGRNDKNEKR